MDRKRTERGAGLVEYGLLLVLIALVCVVAIEALGGTVSGSFEDNGSSMFVRP